MSLQRAIGSREALPLETVLVASARAGTAAPTEPSREWYGTVNVKIKKITQRLLFFFLSFHSVSHCWKTKKMQVSVTMFSGQECVVGRGNEKKRIILVPGF